MATDNDGSHSSVIRSRKHSILLYAFLQKMIAPFLGRSLVYALTFPIAVNAQSASNQSRLGILLITPENVLSSSTAASAARGIRLGSAEAKQTARLFGADVELVERAGQSAVAAATKMLAARQVQVIIGTSPGDAEDLSRLAESRRILFLNIASRAQRLRMACRRFTFHVQATDAMYANAARWQAGSGVGTAAATATSQSDSVVLWDATLQRYGAGQINDRYSARYGVGMDGSAWAGWVAVKIVAEAALRARSSEPSRLLTYLESPTTQFDGHKGWPLTFRAAEHQLRQPLYVVRSAERSSARQVRDVPQLRASLSGTERSTAEERPNQVLDRLIASPTAPRCSWVNGR